MYSAHHGQRTALLISEKRVDDANDKRLRPKWDEPLSPRTLRFLTGALGFALFMFSLLAPWHDPSDGKVHHPGGLAQRPFGVLYLSGSRRVRGALIECDVGAQSASQRGSTARSF
jgi:hypothetical protein